MKNEIVWYAALCLVLPAIPATGAITPACTILCVENHPEYIQ